ncbi:hypothetical protein BDV12DRAFT_196282 [Aspergillus spectabilis]
MSSNHESHEIRRRERPVDENDSTIHIGALHSPPSTLGPGPNPTSYSNTPPVSDLERRFKRAQREINEQRSLLEQARLDLQNKQQEADNLRKQWRESVNELNRFMRQSQGFDPLTDKELTQKAMQLRIAIRDFTVVQFEQDSRNPRIPQASSKFIRSYLKIPRSTLESYMESGPTRAALLKAFLWAYLTDEIFGHFCWAPQKTAKAITGMCDFFVPLRVHESDEIPEAQRRFQAWIASTSTLILDAMSLEEKSYDVQRGFTKDEARHIAKYLSPISI